MAPKRASEKSVTVSGSKKKKKVDSDDDFETVVPRKQTKGMEVLGKGKGVVVIEDDKDGLICRCSPDKLMKALLLMNKKQRRAIYEMGFGNLYHIGVNEISGKLAHWCLSVFEPVSSSLLLPNDKRLHISEEDVWLALGIPKGYRKIVGKAKRITSPMLEEWVDNVGKPKKYIKLDDVVNAMNRDTEGGMWFKKHFLVMVETCLIEHAADGYVRPKILENLADVNAVRDINWCEYMMRQLFIHHESWKSNKTNVFSGPILFLIIVYVDRIVHYHRHIARVFPTVKGWDSNILRIRMKKEMADGGMGLGYLDARFDPTVQFKDFGNEFGEEESEGNDHNSSVEDDAEFDEAAAYTNNVMATTRTIADSMASLILLINEAPEEIRGRRDWAACLDKVNELLQKIDYFSPTLGNPSFSMGFTQDPLFNREVTEDIVDGDQATKDESDNQVEGNASKESVHTDAQIYEDDQDCSGEHGIKDESAGLGDASKSNDCVNTDAKKSENVEIGGDRGLDDNVQQNKGVEDGTVSVDIRSTISDSVKHNVTDHCLKTPAPKATLVDDMGPNTFDEILKRATTSVGGPTKSIIADESIRNVVKDLNTKFAEEWPYEREEAGNIEDNSKRNESDQTERMNVNTEESNTRVLGTKKSSSVDKGKNKVVPNVNTENASQEGEYNGEAPKKKKESNHNMRLRGVFDKKKTSSLKSPFNKRAVTANDKLDLLEREIYYWILTDTSIPDDSMVYDDNIVTLKRGDLKTMRPGSYISTTVINTWTSCLNWQENYKSDDSPMRFFFTTHLWELTVVDTTDVWDARQIQALFNERVGNELNKVRGFKLGKADMVFFPIWKSNHFYVICIHMTRGKAYILDNSNEMDDEDISVKYGEAPKKLLKLYVGYMHRRRFHMWAKNLTGIEIERLRMPWRNDVNKTDSGVYVMRHMETFLGNKMSEFRSGLKIRSKKQIKFLRAKYCASIMTAEYNDHNVDNIEAATAYYKQVCDDKGHVDIENYVLTYQPPPNDQQPVAS